MFTAQKINIKYGDLVYLASEAKRLFDGIKNKFTDYTLSELLDLPEEEIKEMLELERVKQTGTDHD